MTPALAPNVDHDLADAFRAELIRAVFGPDLPSEDTHRTIAAWAAATAPNTLKAVRSDLRIIEAFQRRLTLPALPLAPHRAYALLEERFVAGKAKASIRRLLASAVLLHDLAGLPSPVDATVKWKLKEINRSDNRPVRQARGMRIKGEVGDIHQDEAHPVSLLGLLASLPDDPAGLRDRALLSCGYDAGLRRSEVVRARVEHIDVLPNGEASLFLPRSKTDQEGEGARVWLSARSVEHVQRWTTEAALESGFIFQALSYKVSAHGHLSEQAVSRILKQRLADYLSGLVEAGQLTSGQAHEIVRGTSSHSLRVGCDQDLVAAGLSIGAIMQGLRWSSPRQPLAYARHLAPGSSKLAALMRSVR